MSVTLFNSTNREILSRYDGKNCFAWVRDPLPTSIDNYVGNITTNLNPVYRSHMIDLNVMEAKFRINGSTITGRAISKYSTHLARWGPVGSLVDLDQLLPGTHEEKKETVDDIKERILDANKILPRSETFVTFITCSGFITKFHTHPFPVECVNYTKPTTEIAQYGSCPVGVIIIPPFLSHRSPLFDWNNTAMINAGKLRLMLAIR